MVASGFTGRHPRGGCGRTRPAPGGRHGHPTFFSTYRPARPTRTSRPPSRPGSPGYIDRRLAALENYGSTDSPKGLSRRTKDHLTVDEFADDVGRSAYTVRRWVAEGRVRAIRVRDGGPRGRLLIPRGELDRVIDAGRGGAVPDVAVDPRTTD